MARTPAATERAPSPPSTTLSTEGKVAPYRGLFRGRTDVYPVRWASKTSGKSGCAPACHNEWVAGVCQKPRIKCSECGHRSLASVTDPVIYDHLAGDHIDTYGFSILVQARKKLHDVRSVLMDRSTVETHLDRLVDEGLQTKTIDRSLLTAAELDVYNALLAHDWGASKRLEQERLEWPSALAQVLSALELRTSIRMTRKYQ